MKVHANKTEITIPLAVYDIATTTWALQCWCFSSKDVRFECNGHSVPEFEAYLDDSSGKHLRKAFVWLLTETNLQRFSTNKSSSDSSDSTSTSVSQSAASSSDSSDDSDSDPPKQKAKSKKQK